MGAQQFTVDLNHQLKYQGSVKDKEPHGKGIIYLDGETFIEGNFESGKLTEGKLCFEGGKYEGCFETEKMNGRGKLTTKEGVSFEGVFKDGILESGDIKKKGEYLYKVNKIQRDQFSGQIQFHNLKTNQQINGQFVKGNIHGQGTYRFSHSFYEGNFFQGSINGQGSYNLLNHFYCSGTFSNSLPNGRVSVKYENGDTYQGQMKDGQLHGEGVYKYCNGTTYEGSFYYNSQTGDCKIIYKDSRIVSYVGEVLDGMYNGLGVLQYDEGIIFKGYFFENKKNGPGIYINGRQKYKCLYIMNRLVGSMQKVI